MKRLLAALFASAALLTAGARNPLPLRDSIGKLTISVDPRMELLGAVQLVAGYPLGTRGTPYSSRVQARFGAFAGSDAAECTKKLFRDGFSYDAPAGLMLCFSFPPGLEQQQPYSDYLKGRARGEENLRHYRAALAHFAAESRFADFWTENAAFYRQLLAQCKSTLGGVDIAGMLGSYYNLEQAGYNVVLCPLFGSHNYGPQLPGPDGRMQTYALVSVPQNAAGTLPMDRSGLLGLLLHEFGHSFVNPLVEKHADLVAQSSDRFGPIREKMTARAYGHWSTCVTEHIIRAVVIRLAWKTAGPDAAAKLLRDEERQDFVYIRPLVAKLCEYEALRDSTGITFADYMPALLGVFLDVGIYEPRFRGPVNAVFSGAGVVCVYPTAGDTAGAVAGYARRIVEWVNSRSPQSPWRLVADSVAVKMPLGECSIVCYGTVESNLLLAKYRSELPFRVEPGAIVADRRYDDPEVRLIACMPNPGNPALGMAVYTALDDSKVVDMNNVFHGPEDFCIFTGRERVLSRGDFEKEGGVWRFPHPRP